MTSALLTDLYQFTMAYGYWRHGIHDQPAVFHLSFRTAPFNGKYAVACGLGNAMEFLQKWRIQPDELTYLSELKRSNHTPLFSADFLNYLKDLRLTCDVAAIPEGRLCFAHEPLLRVSGPLLQCQLLETTLLNCMNFQTLIATKAARVCAAAGGGRVLEFGVRRAQGADGALSASRAAFIGGCDATSNVLAGKVYGIPVRGTHAHSWVNVFSDEVAAFLAYAEVMPEDCVLLVDTYDTVTGVKHAITVAKKLAERGAMLRGIRLDSGDMATLSQMARELLDQAGLTQTQIYASNNLNEYEIERLRAAGAKIDVWGVGTHLVTAYDQPALDGVYKLAALGKTDGTWEYKLKVSDAVAKISIPGIHQVRRYYLKGIPQMDILYDLAEGLTDQTPLVALTQPTQSLTLPAYDHAEDLLQPIMQQGQFSYQPEPLDTLRQRALQEVALWQSHYATGVYPVALTAQLAALQAQLKMSVLGGKA